MEGSAKCLPPARAAGRPSAGCPKAESKLLMSTPPHSCSSQRAHTRCTCSTRHTRHAWDGWHQTGALQLCHRLLHLHHRLHVSWIHHLLHSCGFRNISPTCGFAAIICCAIGLLASICSIIAVAHHLLHHLHDFLAVFATLRIVDVFDKLRSAQLVGLSLVGRHRITPVQSADDSILASGAHLRTPERIATTNTPAKTITPPTSNLIPGSSPQNRMPNPTASIGASNK